MRVQGDICLMVGSYGMLVYLLGAQFTTYRINGLDFTLRSCCIALQSA